MRLYAVISMSIVFAILAWIVDLNVAHSEESMVYGAGNETCKMALKHKWMSGSEAAWVGGFMSASAVLSPLHELDPGAPNATRLIAIVYKQCQHDPSKTLASAASLIAERILEHQASETAHSRDPNADLEGAF